MDDPAQNKTFQCPKCGSCRWNTADTRTMKRACSRYYCNFTWPMEDDVLYFFDLSPDEIDDNDENY